jgi:hypothetical protein
MGADRVISDLDSIERMICAAVVIPDRRPTWEWAGGTRPDHSDAAINFGNTTAFRGVYDIRNVPWTKEFLRACDNPYVREITFIAPPQDSGKTKAAETYLSRRIVTAPTNIAFNTTTNVKAEAWSETRWEPMLSSTKGISEKFAANKHLKKKRRIIFRDGTYLLIQGAETEGNRASDSVEVQVNDEVYMWERPWLKEMHDRTGAYRDTKKIINVSVGGTKGSELHERFQAGNQLELHHHCPKCAQLFAYVFDHRHPKCNIRFDINAAILHADGRLDLRAFAKTVLVNCPHCGHKMGYDRERLAEMNQAAVYVPLNPDADSTIVSLHVNAFALGREPWHQILEPWVRLHIRGGVFNPEVLKEFITKKLAEFWDEKPFAVTTELKVSDYTRADILRPKSWPDELFRVMCGDNQRGGKGDIPHRWFGAVAFSKSGVIRLIDAGRINEWPDVRKKQIELGIPDPTEQSPGPWVAFDRRYDPVVVDELCSRYKWYGMMGATQDEFIHPAYSQLAGTRQLFTEPRLIDIGFGTETMGRTFATYFLWSSQRIQDLLAQLRNAGMIQFPRDVMEWCPEIATHMNSHKQFMEADRSGQEKRTWKRIGDTPDHLYDIMCEAVVIGCMAGIIRSEVTTP